jgi:hypothetical protein
MNKTIPIFLILVSTVVLSGCSGNRHQAAPEDSILASVQLPASSNADLTLLKSWTFKAPTRLRADYLYVSGGIDNIDKGSTDWGTAEAKKFRMIGDYAGELRIFYENDRVDTIPLVYGYTLWYKNNWKQGKEPFVSDSVAKALLDSTLYLNHIYDGNDEYILRIRLRKAAVTRIDYYDNQLKDGFAKLHFKIPVIEPLFPRPDSVSEISAADAGMEFYATHTIDTLNSYPEKVKVNLKKLMVLLYSFSADYDNVKEVEIPADYKGPSIVFSGGSEHHQQCVLSKSPRPGKPCGYKRLSP